MTTRRILCTGASGFIGSHLVESLLALPDVTLCNIDIAQPVLPSHKQVWQQGDILDAQQMITLFRDFRPTEVVHLAARADMEGHSLEDYRANTEGTANIVAACKTVPELQRLIVTSSQHVRKPGAPSPRGDEDFDPYKAYGASKVETERITRSSNLSCTWTIVRPTTIWGPGSMVLAQGLWKTLARRLYLHPSPDTVTRSYGYVKNVVAQIEAILTAPKDVVQSKVFYVGDACVNQATWVNAFSQALTGQDVRTAPRGVLMAIAAGGEVLRLFGLRAPLFWSRYKNMVTSNPVPIENTLQLFGSGPYTLARGIEETIAWMRDRGLVGAAAVTVSDRTLR